MAAVKHTRRERAAATRRRIVEAARDLFVDQGYGVTMDAIAARAGVAVQTVYFVFHTKGSLLREASAFMASGGHDVPPVMERAWVAAAFGASSGEAMLEIMVENGTDIFTRVAPLGPAMTAAAGDPDLAGYWRGIGDSRREGIGRLLAAAHARGWLRPGLAWDRARDIMSAVHHPSTHRILVEECGWTPAEYKAWQLEVLREQLLAPSSK